MKKLLYPCLVLFFIAGSYSGFGQPSKPSPSPKNPTHLATFDVRDFTTKSPIEEAVITNQSGQELGQTNNEGLLAINLPHRSAEFYSIQAERYNPMKIRLIESDKNTAKYEVFLPSVELGYKYADIAKREYALNEQRPDLVKVYIKLDPESYEKRSAQGGEISFSVQVAASSNPISQSSAQQQWYELGRVYVQKENGMYKVRIGPFKTQQEAKDVLLAVKSKGKKDAFIVVQQNGEFDAPSVIEISKEMDQSREVEVVASSAAEIPTPDNAEYKVRIASYLHPGAFNPNGIDQLGSLESYRKGEWTIMMLAGFHSLNEAKRAKSIVVSKGFADAVIVVVRGGILQTVQE